MIPLLAVAAAGGGNGIDRGGDCRRRAEWLHGWQAEMGAGAGVTFGGGRTSLSAAVYMLRPLCYGLSPSTRLRELFTAFGLCCWSSRWRC